MEEHAILSERLEDQIKAVEWAKAEHKKGDVSGKLYSIERGN